MMTRAADVGGYQLAPVEDLHCPRRDPSFDFLPQQLERHRIEMLGDLDVVIEVDPAALPLGVFVWRSRQRQQGWAVDLLKQCAPCRAPAAHRAVVQLSDQFADRQVQLRQREEPPVSQLCQDP